MKNRNGIMLICIGKKSTSHFKSRNYNIHSEYIDFWSDLNYADAIKISSVMISKFINGGNKVKISMRFRGREIEHKKLGFALLKKLTDEVSEFAKIEIPPNPEGRQIMMVLVPQTSK